MQANRKEQAVIISIFSNNSKYFNTFKKNEKYLL